MKLRHVHLGRKAMTSLDSILKSRDITLLTKVHTVKARFDPWEDPLEDEMATHSSIAWRIPMDRGAWQATVHRIKKSQT